MSRAPVVVTVRVDTRPARRAWRKLRRRLWRAQAKATVLAFLTGRGKGPRWQVRP